MARGQTLESILNKMRAHARLSLSPSMNIQVTDSHKELLRDEQQRLWEDFAWPHLRVHKLIPLAAGQYEYDLPADDYSAEDDTYTLTMDRVEHVSVFEGGEWCRLHADITEDHYSVHNTLLDERSWPVRAWQATDEDQIEVWPVPDTNADATTYEGYLRVTGIRSLRPFVAEDDRADLDDRLISLYVAGGLLGASGAKDATLKLEAANKLYTKLKGKQTKTTSFNMFGTTQRPASRFRGPSPYIRRYVP